MGSTDVIVPARARVDQRGLPGPGLARIDVSELLADPPPHVGADLHLAHVDEPALPVEEHEHGAEERTEPVVDGTGRGDAGDGLAPERVEVLVDR